MSRQRIDFNGDTEKLFVADSKLSGGYHATIQNLTDKTITITVTNQYIQASPVFHKPASGTLVIPAGSMDSLNEPYQGWKITCSAAYGTVEITEGR